MSASATTKKKAAATAKSTTVSTPAVAPKSPPLTAKHTTVTTRGKKKAAQPEDDDGYGELEVDDASRRSVRQRTNIRTTPLEAAMQTVGLDLAGRDESVATAPAIDLLLPTATTRKSGRSSGSTASTPSEEVLWSFAKPPGPIDAVPEPAGGRDPVETGFTQDPLHDMMQIIASSTKASQVAGIDEAAQSTDDPRMNLSKPGLAYLVDVEEMVREGLASILPGARQGLRMLSENEAKQPFVLRGLSQLVDNQRWKFLQERRGVLLGQKGFVQRQQEKLRILWLERRDPTIWALANARAKFARMSNDFVESFTQPRAFTQLVPAFEVRELDKLWRKMLGSVIEALYIEFVATTITGLEATLPLAQRNTASVLAHLLVDNIVKPVFDRKLAELETATFEDMPLTQERVMYYFFRYMSAALFRLMNPTPAPTAKEVREAIAEHADDMGLFADDNDVLNTGDAFYVPGDTDAEKTELLVYFGSVFTLYASPKFKDYFQLWLESLPVAVVEANIKHIGDLRGYMNRAIELNLTKRAAAAGSGKTTERYYRFYDTMTESQIKESFRQLMIHEVALRRARALRDEIYVAEQFRAFLTSDVGTASLTDRSMFFTQTTDYLDILAAVYVDEITNLSGANELPGSSARQLLKTRYETLLAHIERFGNREGVVRTPHGPLDAGSFPFDYDPGDPGDPGEPAQPAIPADPGDPDAVPPRPPTIGRPAIAARPPRPAVPPSAPNVPFTMFDLSYPLDRALSQFAIDELTQLVRVESTEFDPVAANERASARRSAVNEQYAKRVLDRELAQVDYLLNHVLTEKIEAPACVRHMLGEHTPIVLTVSLELSPVIGARIQGVPTSSQLPADKAAAARLEAGEFRITWYHQSPYFAINQGLERVLMTDVLDTRTQSASLRLHTNGDMSDVVGLAGIYRAEVQQIDPRNKALMIGEVFKSLYVETVVVLAKCVRDDIVYQPALFETGERRHGECRWEENPHDEKYAGDLEQLQTLVIYGFGVAKQKRDERMAVANRQQQFVMAAETPPWGSSAEESLTGLQHQLDSTKRDIFSIENLIGVYIERLYQTLLVIAPDYTDNGRLSPLKSFQQLALAQISEALSMITRADFTANWLLETALDRSMEVTTTDVQNLDRVAFLLSNRRLPASAMGVVFRELWQSRLSNGVERAFSSAYTRFSNLPSNATPGGGKVKPIKIDHSQFGHQVDFENMSFATLLIVLRMPAHFLLCTPREQRFIAQLVEDFGVFVKEYVNVAWCEYARPHLEIDEKLRTMSLVDIKAYIQCNHKKFSARVKSVELFSDRLSRREYDALLRHNSLLPIRPGKREWIGTHSFDSFQPDLARVAFLPTSPRDAAGNFTVLFVARRGSEPAVRDYDFAGLYKVLVERIKFHNDLPLLSTAERIEAADLVGRAVTIYNYFAFLAPPETATTAGVARFIGATEIYERVTTRSAYQKLRFDSSLYL